MRWTIAALILAMTLAGSADDAKPRAFHASLAEGGHKLSATLGEYGGWLIESAERWDETRKSLAAAGVKVEDDLGALDWAKENLACVFHYGDEGDQFSLRGTGGDDKVREVDVAMSYIIYKQRRGLALGVWRLFAVPVAKAVATKVSVSTFHPMNGGPYPTKDKARLEWEWTFADKTGEAVGGVTATIEPKAATVKAGDDIVLKFTLSLADAAKVKEGTFARARDACAVWDGKYSAGYRNHAFVVQTPDGKLLTLRPKVIDQWDKNAPHPVTIQAGKPYVLPNWAEEIGWKSLKQLGLDTTKPGVYVITGTYEETGGPSNRGGPDLWGGVLRSNTVRVEVK